MKKIIAIFTMLLLIATTSFATVKDTTVSADVKYITEKIETGINSIAEGLHVQPEMVYSTLEKQVETEIQMAYLAIKICVFLFIFFLVLGISGNIIAYVQTRKYTRNDWYEVSFGMFAIILYGCATIMLIVALIWCISNYMTIVQLQTNPDYWILSQLLSVIK